MYKIVKYKSNIQKSPNLTKVLLENYRIIEIVIEFESIRDTFTYNFVLIVLILGLISVTYKASKVMKYIKLLFLDCTTEMFSLSRASCSHFWWVPFFAEDWVLSVEEKLVKLSLLLCLDGLPGPKWSISNMIKCAHFDEIILSSYKESKKHRTLSSKVHYDKIIFSVIMIVMNNLKDFLHQNNCFSFTDRNA